MTERFRKATDALYNAFFNGTLAKGTCTACAVGNIVCDAMGGKIFTDPDCGLFVSTVGNEFWGSFFATNYRQQKIEYDRGVDLLLQNLTNYSLDELAQVENAFEKNTKINYLNYNNSSEQDILEDQYKGLCAVFDVLMELDGMDEAEAIHETKLRTHPKLQTA